MGGEKKRKVKGGKMIWNENGGKVGYVKVEKVF